MSTTIRVLATLTLDAYAIPRHDLGLVEAARRWEAASDENMVLGYDEDGHRLIVEQVTKTEYGHTPLDGRTLDELAAHLTAGGHEVTAIDMAAGHVVTVASTYATKEQS